MTRGERRKQARQLRADAPHYTRADIATLYVADRLRIDFEAAERLGSRPTTIMVGDCSPVSLRTPRAPQQPAPISPQRSLSQLLAPPTPAPSTP